MRSLLNILLLVLCIFLSCCGDDSTSEYNSEEIGTITLGGYPIKNLRYESGNEQGFTNSSGEFNYEGNIDFYLGSIKLGSIQGSDHITIFDLTKATYEETFNASDLNVRELLLVLDNDVTPSNGIQINSQAHSLFNLSQDNFIYDEESKSDVSSEYKLFIKDRNEFDTNEKLNELIFQYSSNPTTIGDWNGHICTIGYYSNYLGIINEEQLKRTRSYDVAESFIGKYECNFSGEGYSGSFSFQTDLSYHCTISGKDLGDGTCNGNNISTVYVDINHENGNVGMDLNCLGWLHFYGIVTENGEFISGDFGKYYGTQNPLGTFSCNIVSK